MMLKLLPVALIMTLPWMSLAQAGEVGRTFVATGLAANAPAAAEDFPMAPDSWTESVQDLSLLLARVQQSGRPARRAIRTITLDQAVRSLAWRSTVVEQLGLLFP